MGRYERRICVRLDADTVRLLENVTGRVEAVLGRRVTTSDVVRTAIRYGLDILDAELADAERLHALIRIMRGWDE